MRKYYEKFEAPPVIFLLPFLSGAPVGKGEPPPVLDYPAQVTGLTVSAAQVSWTPNEPEPAGYRVRTTATAGTTVDLTPLVPTFTHGAATASASARGPHAADQWAVAYTGSAAPFG
jgi:hypothetical protein